MSAALVVNLVLLVLVGCILFRQPDQLTLLPLILSKVNPPIETKAPVPGPRRRSPASRRAAPRRRAGKPKGKPKAKRKRKAA